MARNAPSRSRRSGPARTPADPAGCPGRGTRRTAGFTLLELLVAVTILGLLMVLVVNGVQFGVRVWETGRTAAARSAEAETARTFLRAWIEASQPLEVAAPDGSRRLVALGGGPDRMRLPVLMPAHLGGGRRLLDLSVRDEAARRDLVVRGGAVAEVSGAPAETVLVEDVRQVRLAYFGADREGRLVWQPVWQTGGEAPLLVRIEIGFAEADRRVWPPLVAAPMVDGPE